MSCQGVAAIIWGSLEITRVAQWQQVGRTDNGNARRICTVLRMRVSDADDHVAQRMANSTNSEGGQQQ